MAEVTRAEFDAFIKIFDKHCVTQNGSLEKIWEKLDGIDGKLPDKADADSFTEFKRETDKKFAGRPSWAVTIVISVLLAMLALTGSAATAFAVAYFNHLGGG